MGDIITLILVGAVAGFFADKVVKNTFGLVIDILIGIAGAFVGNWLFSTLGIYIGSGILAVIISAFVGAVVLLLAINLFKKR